MLREKCVQGCRRAADRRAATPRRSAATVGGWLRCCALLAIGLGMPTCGWAQTFTWTGGSDNNWQNGSNWTPSGFPAFGGWTVDYVMSGTTNLNPTTPDYIFGNSITFDNTAGAFTISALNSVFQINGGSITNNSSETQSLQANYFYLYNGTTLNAASGDLQLTTYGDDVYVPGLLYVDGSHDTTINGYVYGYGYGSGIIKDGTGTLTINGDMNLNGDVHIDAGTFALNGNSYSGVTYVFDGGKFTGDATLWGDLNVAGIVNPGNGIGTLNVHGTFATAPTAVLQIDVNPSSNPVPGTNNDQIIIGNGTGLTLNGHVEVHGAPGSYTSGTQYFFLSSPNQTLGQFTDIQTDIAGMNAELGYNEFLNGSYWTYFTLVSADPNYGQYAITANQLAAAGYLESVYSGASGDFQTVLNALNGLNSNPGAMQGALTAMGNQVGPSLGAVSLQNTTMMLQQLGNQLRAGNLLSSGAISSNGMPVGNNPSSAVKLVNYEKTNNALAPVLVSQETYSQWRGWAFGYGLAGSASSDGNASGLTYGTGGMLAGAEMRDEEARLGFFTGYQGTNLHLNGLSQTGNVNGGMVGLYLHQDFDYHYSSLIGGGQFNGYSTDRHVQFGGIDRTANGNFSGGLGYLYAEHGLNLQRQSSTIQPYLALQYIGLRQNAYTETGAGSLNLNVDGMNMNSFRSLLGTRWAFAPELESGRRVTPELRALWLHEYMDANGTVNSFFAPIGGSSFAVQGLNLGRDWGILGGGLRYELAEGWQVYANYDVQVNTQQVFHVGSGGFSYNW